MSEQQLQRVLNEVRKVPTWLWRLMMSMTLVAVMISTVVPWAWAQRGYATFGGESMLVFAVAALPLILFRR